MSRSLQAKVQPDGPHVDSLVALGSIVRHARVESRLRIDDAAALSGVSVDLLSRLENGRSGVSTDRLLKVLDALGLAMLVLDKPQLPKVLDALADRVVPDGR